VSRNSEISLQCYLRADEPKRGGDGIADDMGNDVYMGGVRFTPDFDDMDAPQEQWHELSGGSGKGKVMVALAYQPSTVSSALIYSIDTFRLYSRLPSLFCVVPRLFHHIPRSNLGLGIFGYADPDSGAIFPRPCSFRDNTFFYGILVYLPC
jgi:hypothetical protein